MKKYIFSLAFMMLFMMLAGTGHSAPYRVFYLNSYHAGYDWAQKVLKGIKEGLADVQSELEVFDMDTKRHPDEEYKKNAGKKAIAAIDSYKPDLIIASANNAQEYVGRHYAGKDIPLVFCGVLADPRKYGYPSPNVTGLVILPYYKDTLNLLERHFPDVRRTVSIGDDSPITTGGIQRLKSFMSKANLKLKIIKYHQVGTFEDWKKLIAHYQNKADAFLFGMYHTLRDRSGKVVKPEKVMRWTVQNSRLPEVGMIESVMEHGGLMGVVVSGYQHGYSAAKIGVKILGGTKPSDIPIRSPEKGRIVVNSARFRDLGIPLPRSLSRGVTTYRK